MASLLIVSVDFFPKIGGISLMTHHLANGFCQIGWDVTVIAPADALIPEDYTASYNLVVDRDSYPSSRGGLKGLKEKQRIKLFLGAAGSFDHVLLLHPFYYGAAALEYAKENGIKISCYFHGFELKSQLLHKDNMLSWFMGLISPVKTLRQQTLSLVKNVDYVLTNSSETSGVVFSRRRKNVYITGCGLDVEVYKEKKISVSDRKVDSKSSEDEATLGFVGRLVESKNVIFLIDILELLPNFKLLVVGDGPERGRLESRAKLLGVNARITWLGGVSEEKKWEAIDSMDLLCLPSKRLKKGQVEGFGIVMLEATMRGVPVAASHEGGMRDFILENNGIYLDINHKRNSAETISSYLGCKEAIVDSVGNAQKLIEASLTYDKIAENISRLMKSKALPN
ncbi:glycosyltransferase family 4 protein [Microbulbifer sp. CnH-101-E]|uniref:glycosyltransferase family 4 protein n=1 Tax=unclassified Microbulbifer TaxID=2619833 RepID=UPI004039644E